jgi:phage terminase large subunit-like protein
VPPYFVGVDVAHDQSFASIAVCGRRPDGLPQVEMVHSDQGTAWVVDRVAGMKARHKIHDVVLDPMSPAQALVPDFQREGIEPNVKQGRELIGACSRLYDAVINGEVFHNGDPGLTASVLGAARKPYGSAWVFDRRKSKVDTTAVIAATLALWGWSQYTPAPAKVRLIKM